MFLSTLAGLLLAAVLCQAQPTFVSECPDVNCCKDRYLMRAVDDMQLSLSQLKADVRSALTAHKVCPPHFTYIPSVNGCYKVVLDNLNWSEAAVRCRSLHKDAHLVFVNSGEEQTQIARLLAQYNDSMLGNCYTYGRTSYGFVFWTAGQWLDLSAFNSSFVWKLNLTDGPAGVTVGILDMTYTNWYPGQPDNYRQKPEQCMHIWQFSRQPYTWNDEPCWTRSCSVCELDL